MTSAEIRQSFLDFFKSKEHTIVPSSSLMPGAPNLLFTNAGMNQFVPIFLGQQAPDASRRAGVVPGRDTRAADTQKCIRAGGKHNDLEDVGLDTYHHTFFEMLGNWSFGDYFKQEAIAWAWELVAGIWKFPARRLYATVYRPGPGDPAEFDAEAHAHWARLFETAGLDPKAHILDGGKKDNFWMMGETGPCGPCSELHVDLTPEGDSRGRLVNQGSPECIEIWNLVFIQFNANPDGTFAPLPARHVDTGMGFERVASIIQCTQGFTRFGSGISNYETDIFRPIFDQLERLSGKKYGSTLPKAGSTGGTAQEKIDVAFRVIADHIRTLAFAIADGIQPGNNDRNYVLRRILRRAVRYGRSLGFHEPFFFKLVDVLADTMGHVFPEIRQKRSHVQDVIRAEEESFNKTLDEGLRLFEEFAGRSAGPGGQATFGGDAAFLLYDTYGFPLDLTELMARERGMVVEGETFDRLMNEQKKRSTLAHQQRKQIVEVSQIGVTTPTSFVGFDRLETPAKVLEVAALKDKTAVILDASAFYAEMGGQVGDTGELRAGGRQWRVADTQKLGATWLHLIEGGDAPEAGADVVVSVNPGRRHAIERHHTATHLLHWALHEVVSRDAAQKGSFVGPEKLTFDFNGAALTPGQIQDIERLVNERIVENAPVSWVEVPFDEIKNRRDVAQLFGEKYGGRVRVVQIGGTAGRLDGYSMELCGGTHTRASGEIGLFRVVAESAIAAGVRRVEAVAGMEAWRKAQDERHLIKSVADKLNAPVLDVEKKIESLLAQHKELEKRLKSAQQAQAAQTARDIGVRARDVGGVRLIAENLGPADGDYLQAVADALKNQFKGVVVLGGAHLGAVALVATVSPELTQRFQAGKLIQQTAQIVGGKGGGKPDNARGGGKDAGRLDEALRRVADLLV